MHTRPLMRWTAAIAAAALIAAAVPAAAAPHGHGHGHYRGGGGGGGIAAGLIGGMILGGIIASQAQPYYGAPDYYYYGLGRAYGGPGWLAYCSQRYRSFDPASGTYMGYDGQRHYCR